MKLNLEINLKPISKVKGAIGIGLAVVIIYSAYATSLAPVPQVSFVAGMLIFLSLVFLPWAGKSFFKQMKDRLPATASHQVDCKDVKDAKSIQSLLVLAEAPQAGEPHYDVAIFEGPQPALPNVDKTGTYHYEQGAKKGILYVKELSGAKIQFAIRSAWVGNRLHTGDAVGVAAVSKNLAEFADPNMQLTFIFLPTKCIVECPTECTNFYGGMNVDPNGVYKKVNSQIPSTKELVDL